MLAAWAHSQEHLRYMIKWYSRWLTEAGDFLGAGMPPLPEPSKLRDSQLLFPPVVGSPDEVASAQRVVREGKNDPPRARDASAGSRARAQPQFDGTVRA